MTKTIILLLAVVACTVSANILTEAAKEELCSNMKKSGSLFSPLRCEHPDEDPAKHGRSYKLKHPEVTADDLAPVILFPGLGGSALEAQLAKNDSPAWYCFKTYDWFRIWLALEELFVQTCWMDNLQLTYDPQTDTYSNTNGVNIRGLDFGGTDGIDYLYRVLGIGFISVYAPLIQSLEELGYQSGVNLRGVPYDWRIPPTAQGGLYSQVQALIEQTYTANGNKKVQLVTHSMGGPIALYFLNTMEQTWIDTYIAGFIPIAGPWAGSSKALRALVSGDNFGIAIAGFSLADQLSFRAIGRQAGGVIFMVPDPLFWEEQVFVYTQNKNYTAADLGDLFVDIGTPITSTIYGDVIHIIPKLTPPNVITHCLYGTNQSTEFFYHYETNDFDNDPTYTDYSDLGDGTVPLRSLRECQTWAKGQSQPVTIKEFNEQDHTDILEDETLIHYILDVVTGNAQ